jgi:GrpB-like predicted nucleotidyltransferase (UPF0157 family)
LSRGARAQQPEVPAIGYLTTGSPALLPDRVRAFHQGLSETGFVEGAIEYRGIDGRQYGRLAAPAAITTFADGDPAENGWVSDAPPVEAIEIAAYSPEWPVLFEASKELIAQALPGVALNIEHVGSTAVPNLAAKPIIDMDLIVDDPTREETYVPALAALGYVLTIRERTWYEHRMLRHDRPRINLHVFGRNCPEHARHILFRDWLRTHPEDCARYTRVKYEARIGVTNVQDYNRNKEAVVRGIYATIFDTRGWTPFK